MTFPFPHPIGLELAGSSGFERQFHPLLACLLLPLRPFGESTSSGSPVPSKRLKRGLTGFANVLPNAADGRISRGRARRNAEHRKLVVELEAQNVRFAAALEDMSQGLCFFDSAQRLIIYDQHYAEICGISPEALQPDLHLSEAVDCRLEAGSFPTMTRAEYLAWRKIVAVTNARHTSIVEPAMPAFSRSAANRSRTVAGSARTRASPSSAARKA